MESFNVTKQEGIINYSYYFENSKVTVTVKNLKPKTMQKKKMTSPLLTEIIVDIREKADKNI